MKQEKYIGYLALERADILLTVHKGGPFRQYRLNMRVGPDVQRKRISQSRRNSLGRGQRQFHPRADTIRGRSLDLAYKQAGSEVSQRSGTCILAQEVMRIGNC